MVENVYPVGASNIPVDSTEAGMDIDVQYFGMHGTTIRVSSTEAKQLQNIPCSIVIIQNPSGNGNVYVDGIGSAAATQQKSYIIYPGGDSSFPVKNANLLTVIGDNTGDLVRYHVYRNHLQEPIIDYTVADPPDLTVPSVSSVTPANGAVNQEQNVQIAIVFSETIDTETINATNIAITGTGVPTFNLFIDPSNSARVIAQPNTDFSGSTTYTITVSGIKDLAGNTMVGSNITTFTTKATPPPADVTPPTIISKTPDSGSTTAELSSDVVIVFSEALNATFVNSTVFALVKISNSAIIPCAVTLGGDNLTVTMNPTADLEYSTNYRCTILGGAYPQSVNTNMQPDNETGAGSCGCQKKRMI